MTLLSRNLDSDVPDHRRLTSVISESDLSSGVLQQRLLLEYRRTIDLDSNGFPVYHYVYVEPCCKRLWERDCDVLHHLPYDNIGHRNYLH